jgi:predicted metal-dependent hydrolase
MSPATCDAYHPLYLAGIQFFNAGDYFEAHEVWEELWHETAGPQRRFFQGLIQTAVGLLHFCNGNLRGAVSLYRSSQDYLKPYHPHYLGIDVADLSAQVTACFAELLAPPQTQTAPEFPVAAAPIIQLDPPPTTWPADPHALLPDDH